jgi:DNA/RNA endonuclease YhcR with UshA esterase domain
LEFPDDTGSFSNGESYDVETDGSTTLTFRVQGGTETTLAGETIPSNRFTYTGVVGEFRGSYQLIPIRPSDLDVAQGIEAARTAGPGEMVTVTGTITRAFGDFARIQDNSDGGDPSAIYIRQTSGPFFDDVDDGTIEAGTEVSLTGTIGEFNGNLQINNEDLLVYNVVGQGATPTPQSVTLSELAVNGEEYEAELVEVTSVEFTSATGTFANSQSYDVEDPSVTESFTFRVQSESETAIGGESIPSDPFTYTGVVGEFRGSYQLIPILPSDIQ